MIMELYLCHRLSQCLNLRTAYKLCYSRRADVDCCAHFYFLCTNSTTKRDAKQNKTGMHKCVKIAAKLKNIILCVYLIWQHAHTHDLYAPDPLEVSAF